MQGEYTINRKVNKVRIGLKAMEAYACNLCTYYGLSDIDVYRLRRI